MASNNGQTIPDRPFLLRKGFPPLRSLPIDMRGKEATQYIASLNLRDGSVFWLTDDDVRIQATLHVKEDGVEASPHYATIQEVVVGQD